MQTLKDELDLTARLINEGQFEEARARIESVLAGNPVAYRAEFHLSASRVYAELGAFDKSIAASRAAIALQPDYAEAHRNLAAISLLTGKIAEGLREFAWRRKDPALDPQRRYTQPEWRGEPPEETGTLLVISEQWLGDVIQFSRYALPLADAGYDIILEVQPELYPLYRDGFLHKNIRVVPRVSSLEQIADNLPFARFVSLMDVPRYLRSGLDAETNRIPYLKAPSQKGMAQTLGKEGKLKVGLVWAGNPGHARDAARSLDPLLLRPLADRPGIELYSIRKGEQDLSAFTPGTIIDLGEQIGDFADTAAIVQNLDLVITVDTSVAHLAGAMGRPVWTMITALPDWRWGLTGEATPWYPSMRLFRQPAKDDWPSVINQVGAALDEFNNLTGRDSFS